MFLNERVDNFIKEAIIEDVGKGDITTFFIVSPRTKVKSRIIAKDEGVLCGIKVAKRVFDIIDSSLIFRAYKKDGERVYPNDIVAEIKGGAENILKGERLALNFLSHLSGIATYTNMFVKKVAGTKVKIRDTRKTTPNLRFLEKYAVRIGGGVNHRRGLWDGILIKDNHLRCAGIINKNGLDISNLGEMIRTIRKVTKRSIEVEVENFEEFINVIKYKPDIIMLDNFDSRHLKRAVDYRNKYYPRIKLEVSGNINLSNVRKVAESGVEYISLGCITHSSVSLDFSLEVVV